MGKNNSKQLSPVKLDQIHKYLKDDILPWYSMNTKTFCKENEITRNELKDLTYPNGKFVESYMKRFDGDWINVFTFKGVEYVGLQTRKIDYENDKQNKRNFVEEKIRIGHYDKTKSFL